MILAKEWYQRHRAAVETGFAQVNALIEAAVEAVAEAKTSRALDKRTNVYSPQVDIKGLRARHAVAKQVVKQVGELGVAVVKQVGELGVALVKQIGELAVAVVKQVGELAVVGIGKRQAGLKVRSSPAYNEVCGFRIAVQDLRLIEIG